jgi:transposase
VSREANPQHLTIPQQFRRVATRYEKLAVNYLTILTIAAIVIWL